MNRKKVYDLDDRMLNKIISAAYGDASIRDKFFVMKAVSRDPEIRNLFNSYKRTAGEIKKLIEEDCPSELLGSIKTVPLTKTINSFFFDFYSVVFSRPIVSALTTVIMVAAIAIALIVNKPVRLNIKYTQTEILTADQQARKAFAIVGKFFSQTQSMLENEIIGGRVAKPINEGIGIVNNLFEGEKK